MKPYVLGCLAIAFFATGCGKDDPPTPQPGPAPAPVQATGLRELLKEDVKVGAGQVLAEGDIALVEYTGKLQSGKVFDTNTGGESAPFAFNVGMGSVIKGWDQGVVGMKVGGVRKLSVPYALAYGDRDTPEIPAKSDLFFEVKLLDVVKKGEEQIMTPTDVRTGSGKVASDGSTVTIHVVGKFVNGRVFEDSRLGKKPRTFKIGSGEAYPHMEEGVKGMRAGGVRKLRVPPGAAFGATAQGPDFPGNMVLLYEITMVSVK